MDKHTAHQCIALGTLSAKSNTRRAMDTLIMRLESATQCKGLTVTIPTP